MTAGAASAAWVSLSVTAAEVPATLGTPAPTTPVPSRPTRALMGHLIFQEVHTPIHGHGVEVLSTQRPATWSPVMTWLGKP